MPPLQLDHIFCFCSPAVPEVSIAKKHGFAVGKGTRHQGQGTANRSILFEQNYLEFIFLDSIFDATKNPLRLDRRANWKDTGMSPFGIGLRGEISEKDKEYFWEYRPPYMSKGAIMVHNNSKAKPDQPLIFVIPSATSPSKWGNTDKSIYAHQPKTTKIKSVQIEGPSYNWPPMEKIQNIRLTHATEPHMRIILDGTLKSEVTFSELLSMAAN